MAGCSLAEILLSAVVVAPAIPTRYGGFIAEQNRIGWCFQFCHIATYWVEFDRLHGITFHSV